MSALEHFVKSTVDGGYIGRDGTFYQSLFDILWCGTFDFCGCGVPEDAARVVLSYLERIDAGLRGGDDLVAYVCDRATLTEHGSSVGGAWLTDKGRNWMLAMQEVLQDA